MNMKQKAIPLEQFTIKISKESVEFKVSVQDNGKFNLNSKLNAVLQQKGISAVDLSFTEDLR